MKKDLKLKICFDRIIPLKIGSPQETIFNMQKDAVLKHSNTRNLREAFKDIDPEKPIPPSHMALVSQKKWLTGSTLKCRFLDGSSIQRSKVKEKAKIWERYANIQIDFVSTNNEQVRISFQADPGSWSAVGQDALDASYFPKNEATMNFGWLLDDTDDQEYERVVVHEFGHALGCIHEHQSPKEHLQWNVEAVYKEFSGPPNNWSKEEIADNILLKYSPKGIQETIFDPHSIMLYQFPAELFLNHVGTPLNYELSVKDKAFIKKLYPKS